MCPPPPQPRIGGNDGTQGLVLHTAKHEFHDKGGPETRGTFDIVSPPLENVVGWGRETRPFHYFKGEVQICQRWSMRVRSHYSMGADPIKGPGKLCILDALWCNKGTILRGTFDIVSTTLQKVVSSFAPRINVHGATQGLVLHSAKFRLHDKGGQKHDKGREGWQFDIVPPPPPFKSVWGGGACPPVPPQIDAHGVKHTSVCA